MKRKRISILIIFLGLLLLFPGTVKATTYTSTDNLFENSYTNNLIDMAQTQIENITTKKYVIVQVNYDYYFISANKDDVTVNGNRITMEDTKIIRAIRTQNGYNYVYDYSTITEATTYVNANNIIISNIDTTRSISSKRFDDYLSNYYTKMLLVFILGLVFAIFLMNGRRN